MEMKGRILKYYLTISIGIVISSGNGYCQNLNIDQDSLIASFFFDLDIDSSRNLIINNAISNLQNSFIERQTNYIFPILKLVDNKQGLPGSDSTFIALQYNNALLEDRPTHVKEWEPRPATYHQSFEIWTSFSDSLVAFNAFNALRKKLLLIDCKSFYEFPTDDHSGIELLKIELNKNKVLNNINTIISLEFDHGSYYQGKYILTLIYVRHTVEKEDY
jgi:hypothetical protein